MNIENKSRSSIDPCGILALIILSSEALIIKLKKKKNLFSK